MFKRSLAWFSALFLVFVAPLIAQNISPNQVRAPAFAPNQNTVYLSPNCGTQTNCYHAFFDVQYAFHQSCTNTSQTITTSAADPPFVAGDVGKSIVGSSTANVAPQCPPLGTITAVTDAHTVTVSVAATATHTNTGTQSIGLAWGHNDGTAIHTAAVAAQGKGCLVLPQGAGFFDVPPFVDERASPEGPADCIISAGYTLLTPLPTFNYTNCGVDHQACIFDWPAGALQNPNSAYLRDWEILGLEYSLTGTGTGDTLIFSSHTFDYNIWIWGWGNGIGSARAFEGPIASYGNVQYLSGATGCAVETGGGNATVSMNQAFCDGFTNPITIASGANLSTAQGQYGSGGSSSAIIMAGGQWHSDGDVFLGSGSAADTIRVNGGDGYFVDDQVIAAANNSFGALDCATSGGNIHVENSQINGGGGSGLSLRSVSGCNFFDEGGVRQLNANTSLAGGWFGSASTTGTTQTTGNVALTSGWDTSTVTAASGNSLREQFTVTLAGTPTSPGVITITFPTPFIVAPLCTMVDIGGTGSVPTSVTQSTPPSTTGVAYSVASAPFTTGTEIFQLVCSN